MRLPWKFVVVFLLFTGLITLSTEDQSSKDEESKPNLLYNHTDDIFRTEGVKDNKPVIITTNKEEINNENTIAESKDVVLNKDDKHKNNTNIKNINDKLTYKVNKSEHNVEIIENYSTTKTPLLEINDDISVAIKSINVSNNSVVRERPNDNVIIRGDIDPVSEDVDQATNVSDIDASKDTLSKEQPVILKSTSNSDGIMLTMSTVSWLDSFMFYHRDSLWVAINSIFMVVWIIVGAFALYRLLGLPLCSSHIPRTQYLIIHLLIFTAATFKFVQLIHLSFGSHEGLPLFLTLLLTHTPTPCLAGSLILMIYCIFNSARVPVFNNYFPPLLYIGILTSFLILISFLGDIVVGVSYSSIFLLMYRLFLNCVCIFSFMILIINYKKLSNAGYILRRQYRGQTSSFTNNFDEPCNTQILLKDILILWARIVVVACLSGICMCVCCFCLSIFFTVSYVPLWAFWVLHSCIFISQLILVITLTFSAFLTLVDDKKKNRFVKYFMPSWPNQRTYNNSIIKHGNAFYQRVPLSNGPTNINPILPFSLDNDEATPLQNNHLIPILSASPSIKPRVNLRRSATFNCTPAQYSGYAMLPHCSTPIYPVLSEHLLPQTSQSDAQSSNSSRYNESGHDDVYKKQSHAVNNEIVPGHFEVPYGYVSPSRRYYGYGRERYGSLRRTPYESRRMRPSISPYANHPSLAGTIQKLDIVPPQSNNIPVSSEESFVNSFSHSPRIGLKPEPPEKPLRKKEPLLVRGVIKDNIENTHYSSDTSTDHNLEMNCLSQHDNISLGNKSECAGINYSPKSYKHDRLYDKNMKPFLSPKKSKNKDIEEFSFIYRPTKEDEGNLPKPFYTFAKVSNPDLNFDSATNSSNITFENGYNTSPCMNYQNSNTQMNHSSIDEEESSLLKVDCNVKTHEQNGENDSDSTMKESSLSTINTEFDPCTLPNDKKMSLKRSDSTAGYTTSDNEPSENGLIENDSSSKYPWYGTWAGRRPKRKSCKSLQNEKNGLEFGRPLGKLYGSKGSLSSLYGRIKPKRTKSMYQTTNSRGVDEISLSCSSEKDDTKSLDTDIDSRIDSDSRNGDEEKFEDDLFLPRLSEEIDLESEILKSSTMLANFYSLKRSDLKNRKIAREKQRAKNEMQMENCVENGSTDLASHSDDETTFLNATNSNESVREIAISSQVD